MLRKKIIRGFSKLSKDKKIEILSQQHENPEELIKDLKSFWHRDKDTQKLLDEFSENTISNFYIPMGIAPNFIIDNKIYFIPMAIEESSVIAAASNSAKWWAERGGFHTEIISTRKVGQVHFIWYGDKEKLVAKLPLLRKEFMKGTSLIIANMVKRGGGILNIELIDKRNEIDGYYQIKAEFETVDSMGANFINSCLEEFAMILRKFFLEDDDFTLKEKDVKIIMSILSNYTPDCLVKSWVECDVSEFDDIDDEISGEEFVWRFDHAVRIAETDEFRATTHNKGVFNGMDSVALVTGNDFRAIEACGHTYASRTGRYKSLTHLDLVDGKFRYTLTVPLALGTIGGLTALHPLAKRSLELLGNPTAYDLMRIASSVGLANNFGAIKSLVTKGIQKGHMKMHLMNIMNQLNANNSEKEYLGEHFRKNKVTFSSVKEELNSFRSNFKN